MKPRKPIFIAEIKTQSIFGFKSNYSRTHLIDLALEHGDWISVHTDPRFGGSFDDVHLIKSLTDKPVLAKGFHFHEDDALKALDMGADYVLRVDCLPVHDRMWENQVLHEVSNLKNLGRYISPHTGKIEGKFVFNGRNLLTGLPKKTIRDYTNYRSNFKWVCGASLIRHPSDVKRFYPNCDAFIVGEHLPEYLAYEKP